MLKSPQHLLVFRFSALGDVAMTVPVVKSLLQQYPDLHITYVSNAFVAPLFAGIERLHFHAADLKGRHKGVKGLFNLYRELSRTYNFDAIADLHNVLRTKILRLFFGISFKPVAVIDKGRKEKKELTRKENKILKPLKSTIQRYADVFAGLNLPVQLNQESPYRVQPHLIDPDSNDSSNQSQQLTPEHQSSLALNPHRSFLIGVAPFAQHAEKMYPHEKMKEVLRLLLQHQNVKVLLFGGGKSEVVLLKEWEREMPGIESVAGKMSFKEELKLIAQLDVMVSMDSANMHLASLSGVPVVSIWGATHPFAGFYGWGQSPNDAVQVDLYCRPCSVFGNKPCFREDLACMHSISPVVVYNKIIEKVFN
ncbi:glycosyltransferase family 9 protein [Chitinophagaceae bacterium LB-8]|uniref:Glycosyltransferase family 9 protein n=1 Tax=Paraflavisolibacter caeni TaxID=2982496 RepID=A0A9X2Y0X7_9BACT|nr:glycosyltransferase family 9 protein [Paraflavisolibacter caeni]MCU7551118.1 glycosyltransferase family 9 protein [Paraflavisolibacter caeni]